MYILGISAYYHDSAAALVCDGEIVAAAQEERFTRKRHDDQFPIHALKYCLAEAGLTLDDVDWIVFYEKPFLKFERMLETYVNFVPAGFSSFRKAIPLWLRQKLFQKSLLTDELDTLSRGQSMADRLLFAEHHQSHAASAFYPSPFSEAAILTMDGVGEWATTSAAVGRDSRIEIIKEIHFPDSLGMLYSAFTYYTGFKVNSAEYKVMGLAPYGEPRYARAILDHLLDLKEDGSFRLNQAFFNYCSGLTMTNRRFNDLFGGPPRQPDHPLEQRHMDLAASVQAVTEEAMLRMSRALAAETGLPNLCLAGGVALNCVANGKVLRDGRFNRIWIQPASGDAGGSLGAALAAYHIHCGKPRQPQQPDAMRGAYLGPGFDDDEIERRLYAAGAEFQRLDEASLIQAVVDDLAAGLAVGWFQGRMEFGPRALGSRSILGDPRSPTMQSILNLKVKGRESFRPFAPAVLREDVADWFELDDDSPYMLLVADVIKSKRRTITADERLFFGVNKLNVARSEIPAVTHVDYSARVQTVHQDTNPLFHKLLAAFKAHTGCPVLINTSFNVRGEPIVCTPEEAFRCFMGVEIETLVAGSLYLTKSLQNPALKTDYVNDVEPD